MSDITDAIKDNLLNPKEVEGDMGKVVEHSLRDQIEADRYLTNKASLSRANPLRLLKIKPGSGPGGDLS